MAADTEARMISALGAVTGSELFQALNKTPRSMATNYTIVAADINDAFDNTGAGGSVTFTLPPVATSAGFGCWIFVVVDQPVVVAAPSGTLVGPNNAGRTTYTTAASGQRIGTSIFAYCNGAKWFLIVDVKGLTLGTFA
jgi:hypothetical protein